MKLEIKNIGKQYHRQWLFRGVSLSLSTGQSLSVTGSNGSGKSTLLQVIYGLVAASEGDVLLDDSAVYEPHKTFAITSPYLELPLEFSIREIHALYTSLQKTDSTLDAFLDFAEFSSVQAGKQVKLFSSGMQQRLRTALCIHSNAPVLLLDEPLTNMDRQGEVWYRNCISLIKPRICIIAGNNAAEYDWADTNLQLG
jgi:ABC-2 type transport system ATP-binding protein